MNLYRVRTQGKYYAPEVSHDGGVTWRALNNRDLFVTYAAADKVVSDYLDSDAYGKREEGLTDDELVALAEWADDHDISQDTATDDNRLNFARWLYEHGRISEEV